MSYKHAPSFKRVLIMNTDLFSLENGKLVVLPKIVGPEVEGFWAPEGFTNEQHHACYDSISSSGLKEVLDSPYTYLEKTKERQNGKPQKETKSMRFGTIAHLLVLEPNEFRKRIALIPEFGNSKEDKKKKALWLFDQPKEMIYFEDSEAGNKEYKNFVGVVNAILHHDEACEIFKEGVAERSGFYRDPVTGLWSRFRPDFLSTIFEGGLYTDFKTAQSSEYRAFLNQCMDLKYYVSMAMYREGYKILNGHHPKHSSFVVVENKFPFEVAIYPPDDAFLEISHNWYRHSMDLLARCITEKKFPQRQPRSKSLSMPDWMLNKPIPNVEEFFL